MGETVDDSQSLRAFAPALILLAICILINYVDRGNLSIAAPLLQDELGISASQLGILLAAFFWTYTAMQFVSGWLVDRFDVNWVIAAGYLLWSLATATTGIVRGFIILLAMRLMLGIGESVAFPCFSKILAQHVPEYHRGFANGVIQSALRCGNVVGTFGAGLLMAMYGWRPVFIGVGLVSLLWLPAWIKWMPCGRAMGSSSVMTAGFVDISAFFLGRFRWTFLWELPALFHDYLATVLSRPGAPPFHAKHGEDCKCLLFGGCCVGDHERSAFRLLDSKGLYDYSGTQNSYGNRICHGRDRNGCLRSTAAHISTVAYGHWGRMWNVRRRHFRILSDACWSTSGRTMDWPAKWLGEPSRCGRACSDGIRSGSDRQFCSPNGNHYSSVDGRRNRVGVCSRSSGASELAGKWRGL